MSETLRPRILVVTRNLPPLVGGMERLNWHMADELAKFADVRIVGPEGSAALAPTGIEVLEAPLRPLWNFLWRARSLARREARAWRPDIVLAGSGLTAPLARAAARACHATTAVYVHGLDVAVKHLAYRAFWLPAIRRADRVIANSHATAKLCRDIGIDPKRIGIVHPGVDLPMETPSSSIPRPPGGGTHPRSDGGRAPGAGGWCGHERHGDLITFRESHNLGAGPLLLSVGRLSARKGLREFVAQTLPRIIADQPDAMLVIVGDAPNQALHAQTQTRASIQAAADAAGVGSHVRFLGEVTDSELTELFRSASVHVFPVREIPGDPEGFGMVAVEAAAHGLPTVAFAAGGVVDAVAEDRSGHLVAPGNYAAFADAVLRTLAEQDSLDVSIVHFARGFAWPTFGEKIAEQLATINATPLGESPH